MQDEKYKVRVNGKFEWELTEGEVAALDLVRLSGGGFHLLKNGKSFHAEIISFDFSKKAAILKVNGTAFEISIADQFDQLINKMGLSADVIHKISEVRAPMPGLVLSISVEPGQEVVHGDTLLILEAMKMENVLKSPGEGRVSKILVEKGKAVEKGEILIEME